MTETMQDAPIIVPAGESTAPQPEHVFTFMVLHDKILVRQHPEQETSRGGVHLPDTGREAPLEGTVVEVGGGRLTEYGAFLPLKVWKGDVVIFGKHSGVKIEVEGAEYLVMREDEVLGLWRKHEAPKPNVAAEAALREAMEK